MAKSAPTSLEALTQDMVANMRAYKQTGTQAWDARIALRDLAYQAGGLLKLDMQLHNERHRGGKTKDAILRDMETELAEVIAIALFAAHDLKLDILRGINRMLSTDKKKIAARTTR